MEKASRRGELSKIMNGSGFVSTMGVDFSDKEAQVNRFIVDPYSGSPFAGRLMPRNAFIAARVTFAFYFVCAVLAACAGPQVNPPVVQSIPTMMVDFLEVKPCSFRNYQVHKDVFSIRTFRDSRIAQRVVVVAFVLGTPHFLHMPFPLYKEVIVNSVDDGRFSLAKWYEAGSCIHVSYLSGWCCFADAPARFLLLNQNHREFVKP